ncbi:hypothetical protein GPUN_1397 [Glaciecola punicea ACAM 611]|uniref:Polysaccharide export outer membrane protein n=1 Tax=Glaciecola punicea ACAM 611 TaxID=1121923 RepID=H5TB44_9ALTE|nr:SLBB domain-containing protein [Glaciecola punicea]GAB55521.1 hypothetical protein GPUN_1397 [Glaciecola punicea ACAM 611]
MKTFKPYFQLVLLLPFLAAMPANAQSFAPSEQQLAQFKQLPRAQQEQLAQQMGFDMSILDQANKSFGSDEEIFDDVDFIERDLDKRSISKKRAQQSALENDSLELKPFGYDIFGDREEAIKPLANMPVPSNYIMGPGDSVKLQLFGKESGNYELSVNNEGSIELPDLGPLQVAGTNFQELKRLVAEKYQQQKIGVTVFVSMGKIRSIQIFLVGEVYRPGPLVVSGMATITTALINSGGVNEIGSLRNIELKRNGETVSNFDLYDLIVKGDTSNDLRLQQGDVLFVPTAQNIVSVDGPVRRPAIYEVKTTDTVKELLSLAGGLLPKADANLLQLVRKNPSSGLSITNVSMRDSATLNQVLKNGDFLRVPEANLEFSNAIIVNGAINVPRIIADTGVFLSDVVSKQTLYSNTDLHYALILRKQRFALNTTIIQFKPEDVIRGRFDERLQAFDELVLFSRVAQEKEEETEKGNERSLLRNQPQNQNREQNREQSRLQGESNNRFDGRGQNQNNEFANEQSEFEFQKLLEDMKEKEAEHLQDLEKNRFTAKAFERESNRSFSRKELLTPIIERLKSEASATQALQLIEVSGEVKYPGVYPMPTGISISKVLNASGGLTESAHLDNAEITGFTVTDGTLTVAHKNISLISQLLLPEPQQVKLRSKDILNVVRIPQWFESNNIELRGEVVFPGIYQIKDGEKLSNVIKRAGGLTNMASANAAIFTREELKEKEMVNIKKAIEDIRQELATKSLSSNQFTTAVDYGSARQVLDDLIDVEPLGRMVIDIEALIAGNERSDFAVRNGDVLVIPYITPAISIVGEVFVPTTYLYDPDLSLDDYLELAGGVREFGDASNIYIVKSNGSIIVPGNDFWFGGQIKDNLNPGDTIVVPRDVTNYENISLWQGVTQIIYQSAIAVSAISRL